MIKQVLIAFDQLCNAICKGWADETLSARFWRNSSNSWWWFFWYKLVNLIFFWQKNHCYEAYQAEQQRKHLPKEYR